MNGTPHNLSIRAKCLLKTPVFLDQRSFSDFTIEELNDYAGCVYDIGKYFSVDFEKFYLNRLTKEFSYNPKTTIMEQLSANGFIFTKEMCADIIRWERFISFLQYLFNVDGSDKFVYLCRITKIADSKMSANEKKDFNLFADDFFDYIFLELWGIFSKYPIVKQKFLDYFCKIAILKCHKYGYSRLDTMSKSWDTGKIR